MPGVLLDTNVLSELMRPQPSAIVLAWFAQQKEVEFYTSAITQAELLLGVALLPDGKRRDAFASAVEQMFEQDFVGHCLPFDEFAAHEYAALVAIRNKLGMPISTEDAQIAAIALRNGLILATRNIKDFRKISELVLVDPWLPF
ncbi:Toxin FitB [Ferriphaselus amnicola]|uniref:Ribonuclease VapC n=1 Tax=Ferriphaselus amnicola TaxID=1188319 RepID=A0A2Z6GBU5_9PROT|nr:type II toxin-antitoxin system VapC family toxin [Ferriphaselus amnicola]BBE51023.1 Toxin FitB [Ferriphaselus amnicola]